MILEGPIPKAIRTEMRLLGTVMVLVAKTLNALWILYEPSPDIIGERKAHSALYHKRKQIIVNIGGKEVIKEFIHQADFLGAAIFSEANQVFRNLAVDLFGQLEDKGFAMATPHSDHPLVVQAKTSLEIALRVAEVERQTEETKRQQEHLANEHKALKSELDGLFTVARHGQMVTACIPWLAKRGVIVPEKYGAMVGGEIRQMSISLCNYDPKDYPLILHNGFEVYGYPLAYLGKAGGRWIEVNRSRSDRKPWYKN